MIEQVKEAMSSSTNVQGYLFDGFPITQEQGMQFEMEVIILFNNVPNLENVCVEKHCQSYQKQV